MRHRFPPAIAVLVLAAAPVGAQQAPGTVRFTLPDRPPAAGAVQSVDPSGTLVLSLGSPEAAASVSEGYNLLFARTDTPDSPFTVMRVEVTDLDQGGKVTARVGKSAAATLKAGQDVMLFRPAGATTAQLRAVPEIVAATIDRGEGAGEGVAGAAAQARSSNNLKQIMLAFHNYHETHGHFPPAVVYGPDGKPWHSWRVLILPFLEQAALYNAYDFTQPWDSPKNRQVLEQMPDVYRDPLQGPAPDGTHTTDYALVVGDRTAFPTAGLKLANPQASPNDRGPGTPALASFRDGTSNTVLLGPVARDRKIPWTKPEDVPFSPDFTLGGPKGFAAPIASKGADGRESKAALLAFTDGSVRAVSASIEKPLLHALVTPSGGEVIDSSAIPGPDGAGGAGGARMVPVLEIQTSGDRPKATIRQVPADEAPSASPRRDAPPPGSSAPARKTARPPR